jgi:gamma-butyrobetaine dioxygenase
MPDSAPRPTTLHAAAVADGRVAVTWADGTERRFGARWLRLACRCADCGDSRSGMHWVTPADLPADLRPARAGLADDGGLEVAWPDGHVSHYDPAVLADSDPDAADARRLRPRLWDAELTGRLPQVDAAAVRDDDASLYAALAGLRDFGLVHLTGAPSEAEATAAIAERFGPIRTTSYGKVQDLVSTPDPKVAGQTARAQVPHTDEPFRYGPPGVIFFHCIEAGADGGGTSLLVDGFRVAERLRAEHPEAFELLTREPLPFHREHAGEVSFQAEGRAFSLDRAGRVTGLRFNDRCLAPLELPADRADALLDALARLVEQVRDPANQVRIQLQPGDVLAFDNHRVLHGRTAFDPNRARRHLRSCHVDRDALHSAARVLAGRFDPAMSDLVLPQGAIL